MFARRNIYDAITEVLRKREKVGREKFVKLLPQKGKNRKTEKQRNMEYTLYIVYISQPRCGIPVTIR